MIDAGTVDILFGNEDEVRHLTRCNELSDCISALSPKVKTLVITRGAAGSIGFENGNGPCSAKVVPVAKVVDTTGAGDLFAAGFLAAHCRGHPLLKCLDAGASAAAEVITHFGARPEGDLKEWVGDL